MRPGPRNLITDVAGLKVGNASDAAVKSGTTVVTADSPFAAAIHVMGGAPGTRETELLRPGTLVDKVDALVLSGGSIYGLDAATGVVEALRAAGRGHVYAGVSVPIVPVAILMDLMNPGKKDWAANPYPGLGHAAFAAAAEEFALGTEGAGTGATAASLKGGLGSASVVLESGITVGALAAVNPMGSVTMGGGPHFWAAPFEFGDEFGGRGLGAVIDPGAEPASRAAPSDLRPATVLGIVATDAALDVPGIERMAVAAHDGIARAVVPAHTLRDGDLVFGVATGERSLPDPVLDAVRIGHAAASCLARAIARGVYAARPEPGDAVPTWSQKFG